uniref:Ent-kaurene synthase-like 2 n=1 Tax=Talaromyces marneffei PM1 TaxID=1077442 RepID=A0A093VB01_TALMA
MATSCVHRSFATALVFEDDVDWDVDIKYELALMHSQSGIIPLFRRVSIRKMMTNSHHFLHEREWCIAAKLVQMVGDGVDETTSTQFRLWCQNGRLRCITVNPELFHHHKSKGQLSSNIALVEGWEMAEVPIETDFTKNIRYSSRCSSRAGRDASCEDIAVHTRIILASLVYLDSRHSRVVLVMKRTQPQSSDDTPFLHSLLAKIPAVIDDHTIKTNAEVKYGRFNVESIV